MIDVNMKRMMMHVINTNPDTLAICIEALRKTRR